MIIGVPKEIKTKESRVAITARGAKGLAEAGHTVYVERNAGAHSGIADEEYVKAGAKIENSAEAVWKKAEMIVKVKEPLESEYKYFRPDLNIFTYLHLASVPKLVDALCEYKTLSIGYETVETDDHRLPLLTPMSEVAGRIATQIGTYLLHRNHGGKGLLLGGVTGTRRGTVVVIGGGIVGMNAADVAFGLRAETVVLDVNDQRLHEIEKKYGGKMKGVKSTPATIAEWTAKADLLVGAVLIAGDRAPHLVSEQMVTTMQPGSAIVDVAIDQGGCVETIKATSHDDPTYLRHGVIHYAVPNMPALTPHTSTEALTTATFPYVLDLANKGVERAIASDHVLAKGLQTKGGKVTLPVLQKLFPQWA
ncbi:MAG: alanine dehydrogenase [Proteobacteria bacterium]|nr:alanine dehydrogenase [Pseudomonadota bacterium]